MKETRDMLRKHCRVFYGVDSRKMALQYVSEGSRLGVVTFFLEVKEKEYP